VSGLLPLFAVVVGPVLVVALVSFFRRSVRFRWANVFRLYLSLMFGFFGLYGHILHPQGVVDLIPPFFPLRLESSYASGVLELAFAVLIWTRWARITGWAIIAYLLLVLPFNIYGWTVASNVPSYANAPYYLWIRIPLQAVFIAFAWFGTRPGKAPDGALARDAGTQG
jgi:uncharacterized membrane protein